MTKIKLGLVGTSWWSDSMYLPALQSKEAVQVVAVCGRNLEKAADLAKRWNIPEVYTDYHQMLQKSKIDALIISSSNNTHAPFTIEALHLGLHVLCEKPLGLNYQEAWQMAQLAAKQGIVHAVPFTYSFMPDNRFVKQLISEGFIGQPYHCNLRYYTGYGRTSGYSWRSNVELAGSGALGDIGSHFLYIAEWLYGNIGAVTCQFGYPIQRPSLTPDGKPYTCTEDTASLMLSFENGAQGMIHASTVAHEKNIFGQTHHMEFHGSEGTLYTVNDWDTIQKVSGAKNGEALKELPIPDSIWGDLRHDTVHNTYRDVFRKQGLMVGQFIDAIQASTAFLPNFHDGARIQRILDAAILSHQQERRIPVTDIHAS